MCSSDLAEDVFSSNINPFVFILFSFQSTLVFVWIIKAQFFQPTLYKFIILGFLGLSPPTFGLGDLNPVLTIIIIIIKTIQPMGQTRPNLIHVGWVGLDPYDGLGWKNFSIRLMHTLSNNHILTVEHVFMKATITRVTYIRTTWPYLQRYKKSSD